MILILGRGYLGTLIYNSLKLKRGCILVGSKDLNYHNTILLKKFINTNNIEYVINCSGFTGRPNVDEGELKKAECWNLNVSSPLKANELCDKLGVKYIHISSGCIYTGYDKDYTESDNPNFGLFDESSFYSKTKHAFELMSKSLNNKIIRVRMPVSPDNNSRNYLGKILNYENLIDFRNSKTYLPDLCNFLDILIGVDTVGFWVGQDIYNLVNSEPLTTKEVCEIMKSSGKENKNWKFVDVASLQMKAPRSNCVLDGSKVDSLYKMRTETEIIKEALQHV